MIFLASPTLSSLKARARTLVVAANNVADPRSRGVPLDGSPPVGGESALQRVVQTSGPDGVVQTREVSVMLPSVPVDNLSDPRADADGSAAEANVDPAEEFAVQI